MPHDYGQSIFNTYYVIVSPMHEKLLDLERRVRKWRLFSNSRPSTANMSLAVANCNSISAATEFVRTKRSTGCLTEPISRRKFEMQLSFKPRIRRPTDHTLGETSKKLEAEYNRRFEEIEGNSGTLDFSICKYYKLTYEDLEEGCSFGEGTCGRVMHCVYKGRSMAVKRMKRVDNIHSSKRIFMDLDVVTKCHSPYIIKCLGYFISFDYIDICMEPMITCFDKILNLYGKGLPEKVLSKMTFSVLSALDYLKEKHKLMHRDIKPSNILMDIHGNVKLCDFGISGQLIDSQAQTMSKGSTAYLAPERISVDLVLASSPPMYDIRADVWSLGVTIVQLASGRFPYHGYNSVFELMIKIHEEPPPSLEMNQGFSTPLCDFVSDCLHKNMEERPKFKALLYKPFVQKEFWNNFETGKWYREECMDNPIDARNLDGDLVDLHI